MNPLSMLAQGGVSTSSSARSGDAWGTSGTGHKNVTFTGRNPNTVGGVLSNPIVLLAVVAALYIAVK